MTEDTQLLETYAAEASEHAFRTLVERHFNMVYATALRCLGGRGDLAKDACQQVFTLMAREARRLRTHPALPGWLYRTAHNVACRMRRDEERRAARERQAISMPMHDEPGESVDWEAIKPRLDEALSALSNRERDALVLRYFSNCPYARVASDLGVSEDAARMRVERALGKLRALLERRGLRSTAAALASMLAAQGAVAAPAGMAASVGQASLAAAAVLGSAGAGAAIITFMSTSKITIAACAAGLLAVGTAVYEYQQASVNAAFASEASLREQAALASGRALEAKLAATEALLREAEAKAVAAPKAQPDSKTRGLSANELVTDQLFLHPEYVDLAVKQYAMQLRQHYAPFYRKMGFDAAKIAAFEAIEIDKYQLTLDMAAAARAKGLSLTDPSLKNIQYTDANDLEKRQQALIGEEGTRVLKDFLRNMDSRRGVSELASQLSYTASALTSDQSDRLTEIVAANTSVSKSRSGMTSRSSSTVDWEKVQEEATTVLSAEQMGVFNTLVEKRKIDLKMALIKQEVMQKVMAGQASPGS